MSGSAKYHKGKIAIVASKFNYPITRELAMGASATLSEHGVPAENVDLVWVPGAFEIPLVLKKMAASGKYAGLVAVGAVIRGETAHFEYVAGEAARGIARISLEEKIPIAFGVLTTENVEQAWARTGIKGGNKGSEAALVVLEMLDLFNQMEK